MIKSTIPKQRENVNNSEFKRQLEQRKETRKQEERERYSELKFKIISFGSTYGIGIAAILWLVAYFFNHPQIQEISQFYIQTVITLYVGALISKDF